jgi:hypothetical protein
MEREPKRHPGDDGTAGRSHRQGESLPGVAPIATAAPRPIEMSGIEGTFAATGRPFRVAVPADLTHQEACALVKLVAELPEQLAMRRGPRIVVPSGVVLPRQ